MHERETTRPFVLLTGAAGRIGSAFRAHAGDRYRFRLADRVTTTLHETPGGGDHEIIELDVADATACLAACRGIDTVVHLAADPSPAADFYDSLLDNNIKGTYNIFRAAKDAGCRRVIFASSAHVVAGYPPDIQPIEPDVLVRPLNMYGVSKCFGEAVAACFAFGAELSSIVIRIGAYDAKWLRQATAADLAAFVSRRDLNQLLVRCVEAPDIPYAVVSGVSANAVQRLDLDATRQLLGYAPEDDGFLLYPSSSGE